MFDTMTLTKIVGAFCGAFLIFLLGNWAGELIYHGGEDHGHGESHTMGYEIEVEGAGGGAEAEEVVEIPFADVYASADAAKGERVFRKCRACHKLDGSNGTGPHLNGIVDRAVSAVEGYNYSGALVAQADAWTLENLSAFLENPKGWAPGTKMSFSGLSKIEDRANVIAYLAEIEE